jgi:hypothetical protein
VSAGFVPYHVVFSKRKRVRLSDVLAAIAEHDEG